MFKSKLRRLQFTAYLFLRHLVQSTSACLLTMTKGDVTSLTSEHWMIASSTGSITGLLAILVYLTPMYRHYDNRWFFAAIVFIGTFLADWVVHPSHFGGTFSEAAVTAVVAAIISLVFSYTPVTPTIRKIEVWIYSHIARRLKRTE